MNHGLFKCFGAIPAWWCPDRPSLAGKPLSMPDTLTSASTSTHYIADHLRMLGK
jgi:hypothetical protein